MKLESSEDINIASPSPSQIQDAIASLPGGTDSFVILSADGRGFVQAAGSGAEGFVIEYLDASTSSQYQTPASTETLERVVDIFQRYAKGDESWRTLVTWQPLHQATPGKGIPFAYHLIVVAIIAVIVFLMLTK